jgi:CIC family chloride channel protein
LPLLIATGLATGIARILNPRSIYTEELARRGVGWQVTLQGRQLERLDPDPDDVPEPEERDR